MGNQFQITKAIFLPKQELPLEHFLAFCSLQYQNSNSIFLTDSFRRQTNVQTNRSDCQELRLHKKKTLSLQPIPVFFNYSQTFHFQFNK